MGSGFAKRKKQAKQFQQQFAQMQEQLNSVEITGEAGNGLVRIVLSGDHSMKEVVIQPNCVDPEDVEGLQDLIQAAYQDALEKLQKETSGGIPGFPSPGGGFPF